MIIRPRAGADDAEIVGISNQLNPEFPQRTVDEYRAFIDLVPAGVTHYRLVAEANGEVVGHALVQEKFWVAQPGSSFVDIAVRPDRRGQGIGSRLYDRLLPAAQSSGAERIYAEVRDDRPEAQRFAARRGFEETGHVERLSRLDVQNVTWNGYEGLEERLRAEGIDVVTLAELGIHEEMLQAVYAMDMSISRDEPSSELYYLPFERWREWFLARPGVTPASIFVALDGTQLIGLAALARQGPKSAWHRGTGVERAYRGRGIARLLKLRTIRWARENGVDHLYTGNDVNNPRMYAINVRLGYQPLPNSIELRLRNRPD